MSTKTLDKPTKNLVKQTAQPAAPQTNKYIKDSTWVNKELQSMIDAAQADKQIITKVQLFAPQPYTMYQFYNWRKKYEAIPSIQNRLKKIDEVLHSNLITSGQSKNPAFFIFMLKNNYGYTDKKEIETDHTYTFNVTRGLPTTVQRKIVQATATTKN